MAQPATPIEAEPPSPAPQHNRQGLRQQIRAHLQWCTYLGRSVDEEDLSDLAALLRQTAAIMHDFANKADNAHKAAAR